MLQHHEQPDGSGFPRGLYHHQIAPLACVSRQLALSQSVLHGPDAVWLKPRSRRHSSAFVLAYLRSAAACATRLQTELAGGARTSTRAMTARPRAGSLAFAGT